MASRSKAGVIVLPGALNPGVVLPVSQKALTLEGTSVCTRRKPPSDSQHSPKWQDGIPVQLERLLFQIIMSSIYAEPPSSHCAQNPSRSMCDLPGRSWSHGQWVHEP